MIYLASPYSDPNPAVRETRYEATRIFTAKHLLEGKAIYSPIVYGKQMEYMIGTDYLSWKKLNDAMLNAALGMYVLMLDGWDTSKGVSYEIDLAIALQMPIRYFDGPELNR